MTMTVLILGLIVFLGMHSTRVVADGWRARTVSKLGEGAWKALYSVVSLAGFALLIWGYGLARQQPVVLWTPPTGTRHVAALLMVFSFILLVATYIPHNAIKSSVHHPMVLGVKIWALAHLLSNGNLADVVLFGSFLLWAVFSFRAARQRDRNARTVYPPGTVGATVLTVFVGLAAWAAFTIWGHVWLIGVRPLG